MNNVGIVPVRDLCRNLATREQIKILRGDLDAREAELDRREAGARIDHPAVTSDMPSAHTHFAGDLTYLPRKGLVGPADC